MKTKWFASGSLLIIIAVIVISMQLSGEKSSSIKRTPGTIAQVQWDEATEVKANEGGAYPRLLKLNNGDLLLAYDQKNQSTEKTEQKVKKSTDNGQTWHDIQTVAADPDFNYANGQMIQLVDDTVLMAYREISDRSKSLKVSRSLDGGQSWEYFSTIVSHINGVWEPHMIALSDKEVQVYFASEAYQPYFNQVIEMKRSFDGGATWEGNIRVSDDPYSRDGMPVVDILQNGDLFIVIEAWHDDNPRMLIKSLRSKDGGHTWGEKTVLYKPQAGSIAAAPYFIENSVGDIVVGFQTNEDKAADDKSTGMKTIVSTDGGHTWGPPTVSFVNGIWTTLFMLDEHTILAGASGIKLVKGKVEYSIE